jgi:Flp pilus assembly protein TadG
VTAASADRGNAAVEFVAIVPLLFLVGLTVLQLTLVAHAKSIVAAAAAESARAAAVSVSPATAARQTAAEVVADGLGGLPLTDFAIARGEVGGAPVVTVQIEVRPRLALVPDLAVVSGTGHALVEGEP